MAYLHSDREQFRDAIDLAYEQTGVMVQAIEKDYYVTMLLRLLAQRIQNIPFKCPHKLILLFLIFSTITIEKSQMHSSEFGGYTSSSRVF